MSESILKEIHNDIELLKRDVAEIKVRLDEEFELSDWAKKRIAEATKTPLSKFLSQESIEQEFL